MRIAVVGIGGVGGFYGGKLAKYYEDHDYIEIVFVARGEHLEKINQEGLKVITNDEGTFLSRPHIVLEDPSSQGIFDLVIFCVKSYDLEKSAELLRKNADENTVAISLLNGVDNVGKISSALPDITVLNGCVYISAFIEKPGTVRQPSGPCTLFFGQEEGKFNEWPGIEMIFKNAGIKAQYRKDIREVVWEKYIFVCPLASATSYSGKTFGQILDDAESYNLLEGLLYELEAVAKDKRINLPDNIHQISLDKVRSFPHDTRSSMQMDFEKGKKTEIENFTGYVVKYGKEKGIAVPLHDRVYSELISRQESE